MLAINMGTSYIHVPIIQRLSFPWAATSATSATGATGATNTSTLKCTCIGQLHIYTL